MGLTKTVTQVVNQASVAAGIETTLAQCTASDLEKTVQLAVTVKATYNVSGAKTCLLKVWTSFDNTSYDTKEVCGMENDFFAGGTRQRTFYVNPDARYVKFTVKNQDTVYAIANVDVRVCKADLS